MRRSLLALLLLPTLAPAVGPDWVAATHDMAQWNSMRERHSGPNVTSVAISPDGRRLVLSGSAAADGITDIATGRRVVEFESGWTTYATAFSPDGRVVAARCRTGGRPEPIAYRIVLYRADTGRHLLDLPGSPVPQAGPAWSPDGKHVAAGSDDGTVRVWDASSGKETLALKGHKGPVSAVAFAEGRIASGGQDGTVRIWDAKDGKEARVCKGHRGRVSALEFLPGGKQIVSGGYDGTLRLWDAAKGEEVRRFEGHGPGVLAVAVAPRGVSIASGGVDGTLRFWDPDTGKQTAKADLDAGVALQALAFTPDGRSLITGEEQNGARRRNPATGAQREVWGHFSKYIQEDWLGVTALSPDGKLLAAGTTGKRIRLWDWAGRKQSEVGRMPDIVSAVAWSPDGKTLTAGSNRDAAVTLWDVAAGTSKAPFLLPDGDGVESLAYSRDGKMVAVGGLTGTAFFELATGKMTLSLRGGADDVAFSPDGKTLATAGKDGVFRVRAVADGKERWKSDGVKGVPGCVRFSPDGGTVATAAGSMLTWLDAKTGELIRAVETDHKQLTALAWSPDGKSVATTATRGWVSVWVMATGKRSHHLTGGYQPGAWYSVGYLPDGRGLVTANSGNAAVVWDLTGKRGMRDRSPLTYERNG